MLAAKAMMKRIQKDIGGTSDEFNGLDVSKLMATKMTNNQLSEPIEVLNDQWLLNIFFVCLVCVGVDQVQRLLGEQEEVRGISHQTNCAIVWDDTDRTWLKMDGKNQTWHQPDIMRCMCPA